MTPVDIQCHTMLLAAASAEFGLAIRTSDPYRARSTLYNFRKSLGDVALNGLQIRVSPNDSEHEIWIVRQNAAPSITLGNLLDA